MTAMKKLMAGFWYEEKTKMFFSSGKGQADFILTLNKLEVGTLSYADNVWFFSYSEEFKRQRDILPLVNFPTVDKEYSSSELWPFFVSRIPSRAQLQAPKGTERQDLFSLLKNYGRKTIANPYQLIPA